VLQRLPASGYGYSQAAWKLMNLDEVQQILQVSMNPGIAI
jgi:hypothetical protein